MEYSKVDMNGFCSGEETVIKPGAYKGITHVSADAGQLQQAKISIRIAREAEYRATMISVTRDKFS